MPISNNVTRFLDAKKVPYTAFETSVEKLGAQETAQALSVNIEIIYKTIVILRATRNSKNILAIIPGNAVVDIKMLAKAVGEKKLLLSSQQEAENLTRLQTGGISALALINKGFQVIIDDSAHKHKLIHISGGQRGLNIRLAPQDLAILTNARFASICLSNIESG